MKFNIIRGITLLVMLLLLMWVSIKLNLEGDIYAFIFVNFMLAMTVGEYFFYRKKRKEDKENLIKLKNNRLLKNLILPFILMVILSFRQSSILEVIYLIELMLLVFSSVIIVSKSSYKLDQKGFYDVEKEQLISFDNIVGIEQKIDTICIHTTDYQNQLIIKKSKLLQPGWDELKDRIFELAESTNRSKTRISAV